MTLAQLLKYYQNLLIIQYHGLPKAEGTIAALVNPVLMDQLPLAVENGFDISTAVGVQLDTIGKYAGVVRSGVGLQGQPITLSDANFRLLIQMAIVQNSSGSSLSDIQNLLAQFFPNQVFIFDYANMNIDYFLNSGSISLDLAELFITEGLLPKPMAVQLGAVVFAPVLDKFFGMVSYEITTNPNIKPLNTYSSYDMDSPWLRYEDAIVP